MFWRKTYTSLQNGKMVLVKYPYGDWHLQIPEGEFYSGTYLEKMWKTIFSGYSDITPKNILILGSGAGCAAYIARKLWPFAHITGVDYDPTIIQVGKDVYSFNDPNITFVEGDARNFIHEADKTYDFILVDIFVANRPASFLKEKIFLSDLRSSLTEKGNLVINAATGLGGVDKELFSSIQKAFPELSQTRFLGNTLFVTNIKDIPQDYYDIVQSDIRATEVKKYGTEVLGEKQSRIFVKGFFGLALANALYTDNEPLIADIKNCGYKHGVVFWVPWRKRFVPSGWRKSWLPLHAKGNGFSVLSSDYRDKWSQTARKDLKKFEISSYVSPCSKEEFLLGLGASVLSKSLRSMSRDSIKNIPSESLYCFVAKKGDIIVGGFAAIIYDNISYHAASYVTPLGSTLSAGTGLMDAWFQDALSKGIKYMNFGYLRQKWEPRRWDGFSKFKRKFIQREIKFSNGYFKLF